MTFTLLLAFIFLGFSPASSQPACPADQQRTSNWMNNLRLSIPAARQAAATAFGNQPIRKILFGGSHDAGLYTLTSRNPQALLASPNNFITQTYSIKEQLCRGARWFDLRFAYVTTNGVGRWWIFHGESVGPIDAPIAYGPDLDTVIDDLLKFLNSRPSEIVFVRIKLKGGDPIAFAAAWRARLSLLMVGPIAGNLNLPTFTLNQIWAQSVAPALSQLVVMAKDWAPTLPQPQQGYIWDYATVQAGEYSAAHNTKGVFGNCQTGQQVRLAAFKAAPVDRLYGLWWTFTGSAIGGPRSYDVRDNTMYRNRKYPNGLNDFYTRNRGEIGNFIIIDFFGDLAGGALDVMSFVIDYNTKKYAMFEPSVQPDYAYGIKNGPAFPDCVRNGGAGQREVDSADDSGQSSGLSNGQIAGIVVGSVAFVVLVVAVVGYVLFSKASQKAEIP